MFFQSYQIRKLCIFRIQTVKEKGENEKKLFPGDKLDEDDGFERMYIYALTRLH